MDIKAKATIVFAGIFAAGLAVGAVANRAYVQGRIRHLMRQRDQGLLVPWRGPILDRVAKDKREAVEKIFAEHGRKIAAIHDGARREIEADFELLWEDLEAVLSAEEMKRLKEALSRWPPPPLGGRPGRMPPGRGPGGFPPGLGGPPQGPGGAQPGGPGMMRPGGPVRPGGPGGPGQTPPPPPPEKPGEKKRAPGNG